MLMVAPYTGAWIEIGVPEVVAEVIVVAPYTGAWIEIELFESFDKMDKCRSLHGSVD